MFVADCNRMRAASTDGKADFPLMAVHAASWIALALLAAATLCLSSRYMALSVLAGGCTANVSFALLHRDLSAFIKSGPLKPKLFFFLKYYARLTALAALLFFLVHKHMLSPIGLALGLSSVLAGILVIASFFVSKMHPLRKEAA